MFFRDARLEPPTWSRPFDFVRGDDGLGSLEKYSLFSSKMLVNLPDGLPLMVRALTAWIVLLMWRRANSSVRESYERGPSR
jgi:hypothetical protein